MLRVSTQIRVSKFKTTYVLIFVVVCFSLAFLPIIYTHSSSHQFLLHALTISSS
jgi:hypothetical protein